ncbi:acyl-CoA dehydrogenase family protein, partial [Pseudomonas aeruginosa]
LPAFVSEEGAPLTAIAVNEPSLLFDPQKLATRARRKGSHYLLSGEKCLVLRGLEASRLIVAAKTDEGPALFLVEASAKGVERRAEPAMGLKAAGTLTLFRRNRAVPPAFSPIAGSARRSTPLAEASTRNNAGPSSVFAATIRRLASRPRRTRHFS